MVSRIGSLEILATNKEVEELRQVVDFLLANSFPSLPEGEDGYLAMFQEVTTISYPRLCSYPRW